MAILNRTLADEALKYWYLPGLQTQINESSPLLSMLERDSESVQGGQIVMALRHGRQGGIGNRADDGQLPTPNSRKTKQAKWETKNMFATIQISDKTMKISKSDAGAFANLLEAELDDAMTDARDSLSRQCHGDGSGVLSTLPVNTSVTTLVVGSTQYLIEGMLIDIVNSGGTVVTANREILWVDDSTSTIGISGTAVTTAATDVLAVNGSYGLEIQGLKKVFTRNNTLYGVDRNVEKWFNPTTIPVNGEISEITLQKGSDEVDRTAGSKIDFYVASYGVRRAYQNLLLATKQIVEPMKLKGGWTELSYNGKPFTVDKYAPSSTLRGLDLSTWKMYQVEDFNWMDDDGAVLSRVSGKPVWEATMVNYCDLGCSKPRGSFEMTGIVEH